MQISSRTKYMALAVGALAIFSTTDTAQAQTVPMTVAAEIDNTLTIVEVGALHFGDILAVSTATNDVVAVVGTDGVLAVTPGTGGAPATHATGGIVDNALARQAELTVADGGAGATINITIDNVTPPTNVQTFAVSAWQLSYNGGLDTAMTVGAAQGFTFDAGFGGGINTVDIGATITASGATVFTDGTYNGDFDVIFSY